MYNILSLLPLIFQFIFHNIIIIIIKYIGPTVLYYYIGFHNLVLFSCVPYEGFVEHLSINFSPNTKAN